ncbi:bifunctional NAD(P)/FAD-dependent oxidoreductase/class I SAM-dependent methyltransferase [Streptomyces sp. ITFR-16]|uniref:bifunctional NAD(P)/FAD-dependent oxidoreductase/class I SAM-dependent methyltransferase n=1 Tax=Streptomyces sp. ITFR-16 TaxID=3075198 RepID=UPI00288BF3A6|nr:bifunctional NAD(P)/FAD-dependent oxidoreductase/class I SAM-dependent methyltransferase [Streptomyces sp. ITFR-16]WNI22254.1 bifunctional NAD(P)/FAD-dependent oxidoreductase/class I SAM-dependent methyltransferase [Streptomyces sp. ITFR-16]
MSDMTQMYDVVVVGGGAAGLSGALALGRARRSVLVIDGGSPRNAPASHMHNYLGREGTPPAEFLAGGRQEVAGYGVEIVEGEVAQARRLPGDAGFRVVREDGTAVTARRLLVTTGLTDALPPIAGLAERWGQDVLHCPYCHGWEVRDAAIGVVALSPMAVHQALLWRQWSDDVTLFLHTAPEPGDEEYEQLAARGISVVDGEVAGLETAGDRLTGVRLAGGRVVPRDAVVVQPVFTARSAVLEGLGLRPAPLEIGGHQVGTYVEADPAGATEVPGVWAAGNVTGLMEQVIGAAAAGLKTGAAINADLVTDDTARAVEARRAAEAWDARYRESDRIWSGNPNTVLVREVEGLKPGRALDLGCGEGADAVWLARWGWQVTATDISRVALERAAEHAADAGVSDRIDWQFHDLGISFPEGEFDLVSAQFLHSMSELPRERILRRAAGAVAPGGVLLVVGHAGFPAWDHDHQDMKLPTPDEVLASLVLPEGEWEVLLSEEHERVQNDPDGNPTTRRDNALKVRRR